MAKQTYLLRAYVRSFSDPSKKYTIKRKQTGEFTCGCPSWVFKLREDGTRGCKHLDAILNSGDNIERIFLEANTYVLNINGEKWEVLKDVTPNGPAPK